MDSDWSDLRVLFDAAEVVVQDPHGEWHRLEQIARTRGQAACVITAWNPGRLRPGHVVNERANVRLSQRLSALALEIWPADGRSPDLSFHEPGFCIWNPDQRQVLALGREFGQLAIYTVRADGVRETVSCDDGDRQRERGVRES